MQARYAIYFWAIARDDRPWGGPDPPAVVYSYAPGRGAIHALKLLENYRGVVQCDGYAAYKTIADKPCGKAITLAFCWSHLRRKFFDIAKDGNAPIASEALVRIAAIYAIEKTIRERSADERRAVRQEKSKPLVLELKTWFAQQLARVSGKSPVVDAIRYAHHHWDGLTRFLDDGRIELGSQGTQACSWAPCRAFVLGRFAHAAIRPERTTGASRCRGRRLERRGGCSDRARIARMEASSPCLREWRMALLSFQAVESACGAR